MSARLPLILAMLTAGFGAAAAPAAARDYPARGFDRIELRAPAGVGVHTGRGFAVRAEGDPRMVERLTAEVRGGMLVLAFRPGERISNGGELRIFVTAPTLSGAAIPGAGSITVDRVTGARFRGDVSGAGSLKIDRMDVGDVTLGVSGAGSIRTAGTARTLTSDVSGVGSVVAQGLTAQAARIAVSGTGSVRARVDGPADVRLSGVGSVTVTGNARCAVHKSGIGSVHCPGNA